MALTVVITLFFGLFGLIPAAMGSNKAKALGQPSGKYWKAFGITFGALVVLAVAGVLIAWLALGWFTQQASDVSQPAVVTITTQVQEPDPADTFEAPSEDFVEPVAVVVSRTCGADGLSDCYLSERSAPDGDSTEYVRWTEGTIIDIECQVFGRSVTSSALGNSTNVWSRTTNGGWVSNAYLDGVDIYSISTPCS